MNANELNRLIHSYNSSDNSNTEKHRQITQIERLSDIATEKRQAEELLLVNSKTKLTVLLVEQLTIESKGNFTTFTDRQRLERLVPEINDLFADIQRVELKLTIPLEDVLAVIQKNLPELKSSVDNFKPVEHEYSLETLKVALNIRNDMDKKGHNFERAFHRYGEKSLIDQCRSLVA